MVVFRRVTAQKRYLKELKARCRLGGARRYPGGVPRYLGGHLKALPRGPLGGWKLLVDL